MMDPDKNATQAGATSAGVVVVQRQHDTWRVLMLRAYRNWDFPKGMIEAGEALLTAAVREVAEETSITSLEFPWGEAFCETAPYARGKIARYYVGLTTNDRVSLPINSALGRAEHHEYRWVSFDVAHQLAPPRLHPVLEWAQRVITKAREV